MSQRNLSHMPARPHLDRVRKVAAISLGATALGSVLLLLISNIHPGLFPVRAHDVLGALPLALIAVAYLIYQDVRGASAANMCKAALLAIAFLFWAANQFWPEGVRATLYNDLAIALFVLDVFFIIIGWPSGSLDESPADNHPQRLDID